MSGFYQQDFMKLLLKNGLKLTQENVVEAFEDAGYPIAQSNVSKIKNGQSSFNAVKVTNNFEEFIYDRVSSKWKGKFDEGYRHFLELIKDANIQIPKELISPDMNSKESFIKVIAYMKNHGQLNSEKNVQIQEAKAVRFDAVNPIPRISKNIVGRSNELAELQKRISEDNVVIVTGLGGIGKTALVQTYLKLVDEEKLYSEIRYVQYDTSLKKTIATKLSVIGVTEKNVDQRFDKINRFLNQQSNKTLIIVDNMMESPYSPKDQKTYRDLTSGQVNWIFITRGHNDNVKDREMVVKPITPEEQFNLFMDYVKFEGYCTAGNKPRIQKILKKVNGHTLTIILLAKYMEAKLPEPREVLDSIERGIQKFNDEKVDVDTAIDKTAQGSIFTIIKNIFSMSLLTPDLKRALGLLVLLPTDGLDKRTFLEWNKDFKDSENLPEQISRLISLNWIGYTPEDAKLFPHPVIRDVVVDAQAKELFLTLADLNALLRIVEKKLEKPNLDISLAQQYSQIISNAVNMLVHSDEDSEAITRFLEIAEDMDENSAYHEMKTLYQDIENNVTNLKNEWGEKVYQGLAHSHARLGEYKKAINAYKKFIDLANSESKSEEKADTYRKIGTLHRKLGEYSLAFEEFNKALDYYKNNKQNLKRAMILNDRGIAYLNKGEYDLAYKDYDEARQIREDMKDSKRQIAFSLHNIGTVYQKQGRYTEASEKHKAALDKRKEDPREKEEDIAASLNMLGTDYSYIAGREQDAEKNLQEALNIRIKLYGKWHPEVAWSDYALAHFYLRQKDYERALDYAQRAKDIRSNTADKNEKYLKASEKQLKTIQKLMDKD